MTAQEYDRAASSPDVEEFKPRAKYQNGANHAHSTPVLRGPDFFCVSREAPAHRATLILLKY
jgi:hypothetical protein